MAYTSFQIDTILIKADKTMYELGDVAYDNMFSELDEAYDYERDIIFIYKKAVEWGDNYFVGTLKLDQIVEKLSSKLNIYDYGTLSPIYDDGFYQTDQALTLKYVLRSTPLDLGPGLTGDNDFSENQIDIDLDYTYLNNVYVPYTGATQNVDLGERGISSGYFQADLTPTQAAAVGRLTWNDQDGTLDLGLKGGNVTLQIGQEQVARVVNGTGTNLLESEYKAVKIIGAQGQRLQVGLAMANNDANSKDTIGIVTENIGNNQQGFITTSGLVRNIDTTGALQGETWADGDVLYLSGTTPGEITNIKPTAPTHTVIIGFVVHAHQNQGKIFVKVDNGYELEELHDCSPAPYVNNGVLYRDTALNIWKSATIPTLLGYTPTNQSTTLTINGTTYDLSANRTWNVGTVTGTGTQNYVTKWASGGTGIIDSQIFDNGTNVGVGNTTPIQKLHISGNVLADFSDYGFYTAKYNNHLTQNAYFDGTWKSYGPTTSFGSAILFQTAGASNTALEVLVDNSISAANQALTFSSLLKVFTSGNFSLGNTVDAGFRFDVTGTGRFSSNLTANSFIKSGGTSSQYLMADGSVSTLTNPVTGTGAAGRVTYWDGANTVTSSSKLLWDNTNNRLSVNVTPSTWASSFTVFQFGSNSALVNTDINHTELRNNYYFDGSWNRYTTTGAASGITLGYGYAEITAFPSGTAGSIITSFNLGIRVHNTGNVSIKSGTDAGYGFDVNGTSRLNGVTTIGTINAATTDTDRFLVSDSGIIKYRTGAEILSDIGGQGSLTLTTTGTSGAATLVGNVLNIPQYEAEGNYVTTATTLTINGTSYDLSANRSWSVGTVTSVDTSGPLTGGTITGSGTIGITQATTTTDGYLSSTDWNTFNNKQNALTNPVTGTGTTNYISKFTGTSAIGDSSIFDNGSGVGIGTTSLTGYELRLGGNITGSVNSHGVAVDGAIQSDVTGQARLFYTNAATQATSFTLGSIFHFLASQGTFGASSSVTNQHGFRVGATLTGATNNYGFSSDLAVSGTSRWNLFLGTAPNQLQGNTIIGINQGAIGYQSLAIQKNITGNSIAWGVQSVGQIQSDVTSRAEYYGTTASTQDATFTLTNLFHFRATQGTFGASSTVTTQTGFGVAATLIGAGTNYGFRGQIPSGTNRWNLFMDGTALNHLNGNTIIGGTTDAGFKFDVQGTTRLQGTTTISGSTTAASAIARGVNITPTVVAAANNDVLVGVDITPTFTNGAFTGVENTALRVGGSILSRAANPLFIMRDTDLDTNALYLGADFGFASGLISYGSFAINRNPANGVFFNTGRAAAQINLESQVSNSGIVLLTSTTNNTTPTERIRVFGNGNVGIGVGGTDAGFKLDVVGTARFIPSTNQSIQVHTQTISGQATYTAISGGTVTLPSTTGYGLYISQNGNQAGLNAGQGVWLGVGGANHFNVRITTGNIIIQNGGTFTDIASARLQVNSTTQGFLPPRMTTTQKNAIATPVAGLMVYDTTLNKLCVYTTAWETITSA